mgnify:CR=1 FL=1
MAFIRAGTSDTNPKVQMRAYGSLRPPSGVTPLTGRTATSGRTRTGRSLLTFNQPNIPQPEGTPPPVDVASEGRRITGRQGSTGNPIGDAIGNAAKKLAPLIASAFEPDTLGGRGGMTSGQHAAFSDMGNEIASPNILGASGTQLSHNFTPAVPTTIAAMKDGGFIRRRG